MVKTLDAALIKAGYTKYSLGLIHDRPVIDNSTQSG